MITCFMNARRKKTKLDPSTMEAGNDGKMGDFFHELNGQRHTLFFTQCAIYPFLVTTRIFLFSRHVLFSYIFSLCVCLSRCLVKKNSFCSDEATHHLIFPRIVCSWGCPLRSHNFEKTQPLLHQTISFLASPFFKELIVFIHSGIMSVSTRLYPDRHCHPAFFSFFHRCHRAHYLRTFFLHSKWTCWKEEVEIVKRR